MKNVHVRWPARSAVRRRRMIFFRNPGGLPICIKACPDSSGAKSTSNIFLQAKENTSKLHQGKERIRYFNTP